MTLDGIPWSAGSRPVQVGGEWEDGFVPKAVMPTARRTPQIIAHRGSSRDLPEQTLKAYVRAIAEGADVLECDVRLTADQHLVCVHDRRVDRTSNGRGPVSTLELATLEGLDFGSWKLAHGAEVEMPDVDHERDLLLTLRRLIDTVLNCGRERRMSAASHLEETTLELSQLRVDGRVEGPLRSVRHHARSLGSVRASSCSSAAVSR